MRRFVWTSYCMYFLGGTMSVLFGSIMPEFLKHYGITYTSGGFLILLQFVGFILGVPLTAFLMKYIHYRYVLSGAALAVAIAQLSILLLPPISLVYAFGILGGMGAASLETSVASYVMEMFVGRRAIFMSRLEVAFGLGALCMPAIAGGLIAIHWWRFVFLLDGAFALILAVVWQTISIPLETSLASDDADAGTAAPPLFHGRVVKYGMLLAFLLMIFVYVGVEGSLNSFLPSIFQVHLNVVAYFASMSTSVFWIAMVFGRLAIGTIVRRVSYERYLFGSISVGVVFFLLLALSHSAWKAYVIVFILGFALSAIYSITMVYANHTFPGMERTVTSSVTAFAGIGGAVFPAIIGYAMDHLTPGQVPWLILSFITLLLLLFFVVYVSLHLIRQRYGVHGESLPG